MYCTKCGKKLEERHEGINSYWDALLGPLDRLVTHFGHCPTAEFNFDYDQKTQTRTERNFRVEPAGQGV